MPSILVPFFCADLRVLALINRAVFGRHIYAGGGNLQAAELSGVKTKRSPSVFVNMGALGGAGRRSSSPPGSTRPTPNDGTDFELDAIAAAFIGGAAAPAVSAPSSVPSSAAPSWPC